MPTRANLASLTAAIVGTHAGDTLTANTSGTSISASYASGTLSLTGSDTPAHYQTVLQTIKYGNSGAPGVDTITIDVTANDGSLNSTTAVSTINLTPQIDLDTVVAGTGFTTGWYNSGTNAGGQVPISNMTNAAVTSRGGANLTGMTITLDFVPHRRRAGLGHLAECRGAEHLAELLQRHLEPDRQRHGGPLPGSPAVHQLQQHHGDRSGRGHA